MDGSGEALDAEALDSKLIKLKLPRLATTMSCLLFVYGWSHQWAHVCLGIWAHDWHHLGSWMGGARAQLYG